MSYRESGCTSSTRSENFCNICEADFGYVTILLEVDIRLLELWNQVGCSMDCDNAWLMHDCLGQGVSCSELMSVVDSESKFNLFFLPRFVESAVTVCYPYTQPKCEDGWLYEHCTERWYTSSQTTTNAKAFLSSQCHQQKSPNLKPSILSYWQTTGRLWQPPYFHTIGWPFTRLAAGGTNPARAS